MGYSLCVIPGFKNGLISGIFSVFGNGFFKETTRNDV